jgi:MoaA/NifB/PqqE/SkfB family radical SAM enzyme
MKCYAPWHSILVRFNGDIVPDGVYNQRYGNLIQTDLKSILNSPVARSTKESIKNGMIPSECSQCTKKEEVIGHSRRIFFKDILNPMIEHENFTYNENFHDIRFLEFNMSNICNLKCVMCNGISSSAWIKDEIKLAELSKSYLRPVEHPEFGYRKLNSDIIDKLFEFPEYFKNLSYLSIKGGEPYMEDGNKEIFRRLIDLNLEKNITLDVTTNGTIIDEEFHELAKRFKHTKWTVSLEGTGKLYEYIRGGKNHPFELLEQNLESFSQFERVIIAVTIMTYNISHLKTIHDWYLKSKKQNYEIYFNNVVATPPYLNPSVLPDSILEKAKTYNGSLFPNINYKQNERLKDQLLTFVNFTKDLDKIRNTDILSVCPELITLFE